LNIIFVKKYKNFNIILISDIYIEITNTMNNKVLYDSIVKILLYADMIKLVHLTTEKYSAHKLCDEATDAVRSYCDELSEKSFGYFGGPKFKDFNIKQDVFVTDDLGEILGHINDLLVILRKKYEDVDCLVSTIDDFSGKLNQLVYLTSFDKISDYKMKN